MKRLYQKIITGTLVLNLLFTLFSPAFALSGTETKNLDYNNIKVTLNDQLVPLVDANSNAVEPFAIDGTTYLPVRAIATALGLSVEWNQSTSTVQLVSSNTSSYDETFQQDNHALNIYGYQFLLPDYWTTDETSAGNDEFNFHVDAENSFATLTIHPFNDNELSTVSIEEIYSYNDTLMQALASDLDIFSIIRTQKLLTANGMEGIINTCSATLTDNTSNALPIEVFVYFLHPVNSDFLFFSMILATSNGLTYNNDFLTVINNLYPSNRIPISLEISPIIAPFEPKISSGTVGKLPSSLHYNDIHVTLDDIPVVLVDASGKTVEPFAINGTTYLPVRAIASALGLAVNWNQITATVQLTSSDYKQQRNNFNQQTNQTVKLNNYTFSIPQYWNLNSNSSSADALIYYAEQGASVAMLSIESSIDSDPVTLKALYDDNENMIEAVEDLFDICEVTNVSELAFEDGTAGLMYDFSFIQEYGNNLYISGTGKYYCFPSVEDNRWFFITLATSANTDYSYSNDFLSLLEGIRKTSAPPAPTPTPTPAPTPTPDPTPTPKPTSSTGSSSGTKPNATYQGYVYVTRTGSKYHYSSTCNGGRYYQSTLEDAKRRGLTPCSKCVLH